MKKRQIKITADNTFNFFYFYLSKKITLNVLCASRGLTFIQVLFSLKNKEKVFMNVVCGSCDQRFKSYEAAADS